jgi:predicted HTH transcriptional regulator
MTEQEFATLLAKGHELHDTEFKGPGKRSDKAFMAKVIRAVLGMANRRDGGRIIIGVEEDDEVLNPIGLTEDQLDTWKSYDKLSVVINEYAQPSVSFDREFLTYKGNQLVIIRVLEFDDVPILCQRDLHDSPSPKKNTAPMLRRGALYTRGRQSPKTTEVSTAEDMRELLDLAIEKGVHRFLERARRVGLFHPGPAPPTELTDEARFEKQKEELQ